MKVKNTDNNFKKTSRGNVEFYKIEEKLRKTALNFLGSVYIVEYHSVFLIRSIKSWFAKDNLRVRMERIDRYFEYIFDIASIRNS